MSTVLNQSTGSFLFFDCNQLDKSNGLNQMVNSQTLNQYAEKECCKFVEEIKKLKKEYNQGVQTILKNKSNEIMILTNENKKLKENEKIFSNEIQILKDELIKNEKIEKLSSINKDLVKENRDLKESEKKLIEEIQLLKEILKSYESNQCNSNKLSEVNIDHKEMLAIKHEPVMLLSNKRISNRINDSISNKRVKKLCSEERNTVHSKAESSFEDDNDCIEIIDPKCEIECEIKKDINTDRLLNLNIWKNISNTSSKVLSKPNLDKNQLEEINYIDKKMQDTINSIGFSTVKCLIRKTANGYTLNKYCSVSKCKCSFTLQIRVPSGKGTLYSTNRCKHTFLKS